MQFLLVGTYMSFELEKDMSLLRRQNRSILLSSC